MSKKNIIQFMPYFPPHIGGVEKVGEDIFLKWTYGDSIVFSGELEKKYYVYNKDYRGKMDKRQYLGYPCFDMVDNFPIPLLWTKKYRFTIKELEKIIDENKDEDFYVITHTRFFLSSLIGGRFAKKNNLKWIHIEHGSDYVKLSSKFKNKIAYIYDRSIGKYIFRNADKILAISHAAESFIKTEFNKESTTWYRGVDFPKFEAKNKKEIILVFVGRLVHLKGVNILLEALSKTNIKNHLVIFGDGDEKQQLESLTQNLGISNRVIFKGFIKSSKIINFLSENRCLLVNPSFQEGMPTTVIEALATKNVVIASKVGGTAEISEQNDLILFKPGDVLELSQKINLGIEKFSDLEGESYTHMYEKFSWNNSLGNLYKKLN